MPTGARQAISCTARLGPPEHRETRSETPAAERQPREEARDGSRAQESFVEVVRTHFEGAKEDGGCESPEGEGANPWDGQRDTLDDREEAKAHGADHPDQESHREQVSRGIHQEAAGDAGHGEDRAEEESDSSEAGADERQTEEP